MLDLVYRVKIFFWWLWNVKLDGIHIVVRFDQDVAFLHVFVDVDFNFYAVAGDAADGVCRKFLAQERDVDDFLVSSVMRCSKDSIAKHGENIKNARRG